MRNCTIIFVYLLFTISTFAQPKGKAEALAKQYCGSCHIYPEPDLLPQHIWVNNVLPNMGKRLGVKTIKKDYEEDKTKIEKKIAADLNVYSKVQLISDSDWQEIVNFYSFNAPKEPLKQEPKINPQKLSSFSVNQMFLEGDPIPKTTLLYANENSGELFFGDANKQLFVKDATNNLYSLPEINSPPVLMTQKTDGVFNVLCVGNINPTDLSNGRVYEMNLQEGKWEIIQDSLSRPVDMLWADLNQDGTSDLIIANFGNNIGSIDVYFNGIHKKTVIERPGARKIEVYDFNNDGLPDIIGMFCQGREGISIFYNNGDGTFQEETILEFHPLMGLSYMQLADFNNDGKPDILLSNGDNWDYSTVLKNFHGLRIFINKGDNTFEQTWFYPQYGTAKSLAYDFDNDGDLDIVSTAFYNNLYNPEENFLYFENKGDSTFQPYYIEDTQYGKWLTLEVADLDQDGDKDIFLGSYFHNTVEYTKYMAAGMTTRPQILILTNKLK